MLPERLSLCLLTPSLSPDPLRTQQKLPPPRPSSHKTKPSWEGVGVGGCSIRKFLMGVNSKLIQPLSLMDLMEVEGVRESRRA